MKEERCPEEITDEERLEELGIFKDDDKENETDDEDDAWRNYV